MKHLKSYKIFESVDVIREDKIKSDITDILRENILDKDIPLMIIIKNLLMVIYARY